MKRSTTSTIAVIVVVALVVVVGAGVAVVGFGTDGAPAVEVGDRTVSRESVNDELRAVADNELLVTSVGADRVTRTNGSVVSEAAAALVLTGALQEALIKEYLDRNGERITDADRTAGEELFPQTGIGQYSKGFPKWYRDRSAERLAAYAALARVSGIDLESETSIDDIASELRPVARGSGVTIDPRYGRFRTSDVSVVPYRLPAGLLDSSSTGSSG